MNKPSAAIVDVASHLPERELTNEQLAAELGGWTADEILARTGVRSRRVAAENELASDLGVISAEKLFRVDPSRREAVDFLIFCTQSPDYFLPTTACLMHKRLGLRADCGAFDINLGCSGFVYGLGLAKSLIDAGTARHVLLVNADTYSKFINPRDGSVRTIFGDAAASTLLSATDGPEEPIGPFVFGTAGSEGDLVVPAGGMRMPLGAASAVETQDQSGNWRSPRDLFMNGPEVFNFTLRVVPETIDRLLRKASRSMAEIDLFVFHQASRFMLEHLRKKLRIPPERFFIDIEDCGNTVSCTIPIALQRARASGQLRPGALVMVVGYGVGYSWAAGLLRMS